MFLSPLSSSTPFEIVFLRPHSLSCILYSLKHSLGEMAKKRSDTTTSAAKGKTVIQKKAVPVSKALVKKPKVSASKKLQQKKIQNTKISPDVAKNAVQKKRGPVKKVVVKKSTKVVKKSTKPMIVIEDSDSEEVVVKKGGKGKAKSPATPIKGKTVAKPVTPVKGKAASAKPVTPMKSAAAPTKKRNIVRVAIPDDITEVVRQIAIQNKTSKLTVEKIVKLVNEEYLDVDAIAVSTAIANLFRTGFLSESKSYFTVEEDIIKQLAAPAVEEPIVETVDIVEEPVAAAATEEPEGIEEEEPVANTTAYVDGESETTSQPVVAFVTKEDVVIGSARKSTAKANVETPVASARKSAVKSVGKSAAKAEVSSPTAEIATAALINDEEAEALQVLGEDAI